MRFSITPNGVLARIPIITCGDETFGDLYWFTDRDRGHRALLRLESNSNNPLSSTPMYRVGSPRTLRVDWPEEIGHQQYTINGHAVSVSWQTVLLEHRPLRNYNCMFRYLIQILLFC